MAKPGRPRKDANAGDARQRIIDATVAIISQKGADAVTVRSVCEKSGLSNGTFYHHFANKDELMMEFVHDSLFGEAQLNHPLDQIAERICDLYLHLLHGYMGMGKDFMKSFYSTNNTALSAYMGTHDGAFAPGTIMEKSEVEMRAAQDAGLVDPAADAHTICCDICTIVKGCVFEWCLEDGRMDVEAALHRLVGNYLRPYLRG
ncbi:Uncharacterized HTH-type transcriptional regulator yvdT [Slackia heliotrinireducens]|uniref:Transcriptional regulator n=1 Tax=Slackia heliotrinireducens (strain ATCC 29202 / DSM 20476 / NCTC 11029 / RHS 1) TaxID=471855 RepID=C7N151_SLAHD|nr:TetR/AcrR family transcriptional regulator [Slackia heliotrinireducens]ACV23273.1 transcriptional regulator [Slackia heliotrinireducens DSM 20476]VEH02434.1 Uncharacterized HTH-type transcriptional regulator yvdT [Slackia heliotrinireducens]